MDTLCLFYVAKWELSLMLAKDWPLCIRSCVLKELCAETPNSLLANPVFSGPALVGPSLGVPNLQVLFPWTPSAHFWIFWHHTYHIPPLSSWAPHHTWTESVLSLFPCWLWLHPGFRTLAHLNWRLAQPSYCGGNNLSLADDLLQHHSSAHSFKLSCLTICGRLEDASFLAIINSIPSAPDKFSFR